METFIEKVFETNNYKRVYNCCFDALQNHKFIAIIGNAGWGKSIALQEFKEKYPHLVSYVCAYVSMNAKLFYHDVLNSIEETNYSASLEPGIYVRRAADKFRESGTNKLLIIDEAGQMSTKMFRHLHEFRNRTMSNTGIILAGVDYLKSNMEAWVKKPVIGMPEVYSRINSWQILKKPSQSEKRNFIESYEIHDEKIIDYCMESPDYRILTNRIRDYFTVIKQRQKIDV